MQQLLQPDDLVLPALWLGGQNDWSITPCQTMREVVLTNDFSLRKRFHEHALLIDSAANQHKVAVIRVASPANRLLRFLAWVINRRVYVDLAVLERSPLTLIQMKKIVVGRIRKDRGFWQSGGEASSIVKRVNHAASPADVVQVFVDYFAMRW